MSNTITKAELEAQNKALKEQIEELRALLTSAPVMAAQPSVVTVAPASTDVTIVYTSDSEGVISYSIGNLVAHTYGEEFTVSRSAFDEIVGKYRHWFDEGILAVSEKNADVAAAKRLPTDKKCGLTAEKLDMLGTMTIKELETLWNSLKTSSAKDSIILSYKRKFTENVPGYQDYDRVVALNSISGGRLATELELMNGRNFVSPTDLNAGPKDVIKVI